MSNKKHNKQRQEKSQSEQEQTKQRVEAVRAALLALDDEQLPRVVARICAFTHDGEQLRKLLGYQVRAVPTDTLYSTEAELTAAEPDGPFTFVAPTSDAVRARFATPPAHQLLPIFKAMSNRVPAIKNAAWHQRLQVELPALANTPIAAEPPPVVNPAFAADLLDDALRQSVQAHKDALLQSLATDVIDISRAMTRFAIDERGHLHDMRVPFILEDYATVDDFLEEWDGKAGEVAQLSWRVRSTILDMITGLLPQALAWLERENPAYYAEHAPQSKVPIKELRGWTINSTVGQLDAQRIPADDLYWAMNTDNQTGKRLDVEPDVRYC